MTTFDRDWDAAYEAVPADTDVVSQGALRIRNLKTDIQQRMAVDHKWGGDADDGQHVQVTLQPLSADPTGITGEAAGFLYTKQVSGNTELFYFDTGGGYVIQLTSSSRLLLTDTATPFVSTSTINAVEFIVNGSNDMRMRMDVANPTLDMESASATRMYFDTGTRQFVFVVDGVEVSRFP